MDETSERDVRIAEIKARNKIRTQGEWEVRRSGGAYYVNSIDFFVVGEAMVNDDAAFIAHAPDDIEFLLGEVERLEKELTRETQ